MTRSISEMIRQIWVSQWIPMKEWLTTHLVTLYDSMKIILRMQRELEPEIATVGEKGQIVIPYELRRKLKIVPKSKVAIYRRNDKLVLTKLSILPLREELKDLFAKIDKKEEEEQHSKGGRRPTEKEILSEIQTYRHEKRR
jgi:AbrB family looped-hinge helix DNA binding protein